MKRQIFPTGFITVISYIALKFIQVANSSHVIKHLQVQNKQQSFKRSTSFRIYSLNNQMINTTNGNRRPLCHIDKPRKQLDSKQHLVHLW